MAEEKKGGCLTNLLIVVGAFIICAVVVKIASNDGGAGEVQYIPDSFDAISYAQDKVKKHLKSPSTAVFPSYSEKLKHIEGNYPNYKINSWVDSQNGFGAVIRTYYSCEVIYDDKHVRLVNLQIE